MSDGISVFTRVSLVKNESKMESWVILSNQDNKIAGTIDRHRRTSLYKFSPRPGTSFNAESLSEIAFFLKKKNDDIRKERNMEKTEK